MEAMERPGHVMKISRNGQVSLPADVRQRWGVERVLIVEVGDHLVVRPLEPGDPRIALRGKYAGRGTTASTAVRELREEDAAAERRRRS